MTNEVVSDVALGRKTADLAIVNGKIVNVHTAEIYSCDIAVKNDKIASLTDVRESIGKNTTVLDAAGRYVTPGAIESHIHVAGSHLSMTEFARVVMAHGTTTVATDFYEIGIVGGVKAIKYCLEEFKKTPLKILFVVPMPAYYQNRPFATTGNITPREFKEMLMWRECVGLNEPFTLHALQKDRLTLDLIRLTKGLGKTIVGHASETRGREMNAYLVKTGGLVSDHESKTSEEALEKVRMGSRILLREGSATSDLNEVVRAVTERKIDARYFMYCTDEEDPRRLSSLGHIDYRIRLAVKSGVNPIVAVQMATINAAEYFRIDDKVGSIGPSKMADLLIVDDLAKFKVESVVANGKVVVRNGDFLGKLHIPKYPSWMRNTVRLRKKLTAEDFEVRAPSESPRVAVRVIGVAEDNLITESRSATLKVENRRVLADVKNDVLKIAVVERHKKSGDIGVGFIQGFTLREGAIASTFNPHSENIVIVGTNDSDMAFAANELARVGGGFIAVRRGAVVSLLELPILGLLSDNPLKEVTGDLNNVVDAVRTLGCNFRSPFISLGFVVMAVGIGTLKICQRGLVYVPEPPSAPKLVETIIPEKSCQGAD